MNEKNTILILFVILLFLVGFIFYKRDFSYFTVVKAEKRVNSTKYTLVKPSIDKEHSIKIVNGFVKITDIDPNLVVDLKYATVDNFTKRKVYNSDICILRLETAIKLSKADEEFMTAGYKIKIWDGYRPLDVQKIFWSICPNSAFVANPYKNGSRHNYGAAVDITLVDSNGKEVIMPSGFDDFTLKASRNNPETTPEAKKNLDYLTEVMKKNGFITINTEWWHFEDSDYAKYSISNIDPEIFK